jgi:hypothetical protein
MALSPNYGWAEPDNSSLVKNGAQDIRALGDAIDTSVWNVGYGQAGKNKIINGDFSINQRSFTTDTIGAYGFDRWTWGSSGATGTYSTQAFTAGAAPVAGYEATNFARVAVTTGNDFCRLIQRIESVRTFAGQTATLSFWAKGTNPTTAGKLNVRLQQNFGSGGSASVDTAEQDLTLTANWVRYSYTFAIPSISGKTIGTASYLEVGIGQLANASTQSWTLDLWGVQLEYGSKATPFQTASGGSPQAELAMCQRYYVRWTGNVAYSVFGTGIAASTTAAVINIPTPTTMRTNPTTLDFSTLGVAEGGGSVIAGTSATFNTTNDKIAQVQIGVASGLTQFRPVTLYTNNSAAGFIGFSAEL